MSAVDSAIERITANARQADPPPHLTPEAHAALVAAAERFSDLANSDRLARRCVDAARFCHGHGWLVYDGCRWKIDTTDRIMEFAKEVARANVAEALLDPDERARDGALKAAKRTLQGPRIVAMVMLCQSHPAVRITASELDADRWLLNVRNGTLDLRTGTLREHRRDDLITRLAPVDFDPAATSARWEAFIARIMLDRPELLAFLRRLAGACLSGEVREHVFIVFYGLGANGKGTLIRVFQRVLGDYAKTADINTFLEQGSDIGGSRHQEDIARLDGSRFVSAEEASPGKSLNLGRIKTLTGGDRVNARLPYAKLSLEYFPQFTLVLAVNHRPAVPASDWGTWRRIKLVPFDATIGDDEQRANPDFEKRLAEEDPGILNWMVQGCLEWQRDGLGLPEEVREATQKYHQDADPLQRFLDERCVKEVFATVSAKDLRAAYETWCAENDEVPLSVQALGRRLTDRAVGTGRGTKGEKTRTGIGLKQES